MSVEELKRAIFELPSEERRELIDSFQNTRVKLTPEQKAKYRAELDAIPEDDWIDWEVLKAEFEGAA